MQDEEVARTIQEREDHKFLKEKQREAMDEKLGTFTHNYVMSCDPGLQLVRFQ